MKRIRRYLAALLAAAVFMLMGTANEPLQAQTLQTSSSAAVNYTVVENSSVALPGTENIVVSIGTIGGSGLSSAALTYRNTRTDERFQTGAVQIYEDAALFSIDFSGEDSEGIYELTELSAVVDGEEITIPYEREVMFGVNETVETEPDDFVVEESSVESTARAQEDTAETVSGMQEEVADLVVKSQAEDAAERVEQALGNIAADAASKGAAEAVDSTGKSDLVVVLDPGHGGSDSGAAANGLYEKNLTLKIGTYCKAELEKYSGVKVYMTRSNDTYLSIDQRIAYASSVKADVFVSLHINAAVNTSANGAEVYYPNSNYRPSYSTEGKGLAEEILDKLTALGLNDRGTKILNSQTGNTYADGSLADYYGVIRGAKNAGFPGIIVEHAFISNTSDAGTYLGSDTALKKLGAADAQGIAAYYGLKTGSGSTALSKTSMTKLVAKDSGYVYLKWKKVSGASGYEIYRSTAKNGTYKRIQAIAKGSTVSYKDKTVKGGKTYYYKIRALKTSGGETQKSGFCSVQKIKVMKKPAISALKASSATTRTLKWKKVSGAVKYQIYRSTSKNGSYKKIAAVKNVTSYKDKNLKKNKTYYYKIRAVGSGVGGSSYSSYSAVKGK